MPTNTGSSDLGRTYYDSQTVTSWSFYLVGRQHCKTTRTPKTRTKCEPTTGRWYQLIFVGAVQGIRNPDAHEPFKLLADDEALERLALASILI